MFPADYLRYCGPDCTTEGAFEGLTYTTNILTTDDEGVQHKQEGVKDGLVGRLPCKLFEDLVEAYKARKAMIEFIEKNPERKTISDIIYNKDKQIVIDVNYLCIFKRWKESN